MEIENIILRGNPDKEKQLLHIFIHRWFLKIKQRKPAYKPQCQST